MADTSGLPPEGWYPDRPNATRLRHWTGTGWTNEFRPVSDAPETDRMPEPTPGPVEPVRETTDQARSRRELRAQVGSLVQGEPDTPPAGVAVVAPEPQPDPVAEPAPAPQAVAELEPEPAPVVVARPAPFQYDPLPEPAAVAVASPAALTGDRGRSTAGYTPARQQPWQDSFATTTPTASSQTFAGWLYAVSPLWLGALMIAGTALLSIVNPLLVQGGLALVGFALTFLLARQDIRQLVSRGHRAPSLWLILLPLVYFVVRMVRVGMRSAGMVVTYLLSSVALVVLLYFAFMGNPVLLSVLTPSVPAETSAIPTPVATLSAQERENLLTEAGTEAQLRLELGKTFDVGAVDCVPFPSADPGTTTSCVVVLDGVSYNAGLEVTPDEPGTAFLLTGMLPVEN